jgi:ubiquinol-cytochrome c reductase iron-sulfur subunit
MAQDDHSGTDVAAVDSSHAEHDLAVSPGTAIIATDTFENPGFPAHRPRVVDEEPKRAKRAQRTVYTLFYLSILGSVWAIAAYMLFPIESNDVGMVRLNNMFVGLGATLALLGIGFGVVHWG